LFLFSCNNEDRIEAICTFNVGFNLDARQPILNTLEFTSTNPVTYASSASTSFFDMSSSEHLASMYFIKTDTNQWDVYFYENDMAFDITDGFTGANQQLLGRLTFDTQGVLESISPEELISEDLIFDDKDYIHKLRFDFTYLTTQSDSGFAVTMGDVGCSA